MNNGFKKYLKAKNIIPTGNSLLSKNPELFLPDYWPSYFKKAKGCEIWDLDGNKFFDLSTMSVGTNILGYSYAPVNTAVKKAIDSSVMSSLNAIEEVHLAEKLIELNSWADMAKFTRSGGEANSVAIRIARAATGRDKVLICGYHGWHDWYLSANLSKGSNLDELLLPGLNPLGVPKSLQNTTIPFKYNDFDGVEKIVAENKDEIAAIKMEVMRNIEPEGDFIKKIRKLCNENNIVLIFDECTSGFREFFGGLYSKYNVEPDMVMYSKAIGNGHPICAVLGRKEIMKPSKDSFMSSTFWTERLGPVAALKTLDEMKKLKSWKDITEKGKYIQKSWASIAKANSIEIKISGLPALSSFSFTKNNDELRSFTIYEMLKKGFLTGNTIYLSIAHTYEILDRYLDKLNDIFYTISLHNSGESHEITKLKLKKSTTGFGRLN